MAESSRSAGKKRVRDEGEVESVESLEEALTLGDNLTFSDTLMALRMMRAQFPKIEKVSLQPFILQSQLYSSVRDRTQVDRELESLKKEKVLRIFKLNTGRDDHAIMFMEDYFNLIGVAMKRLGMKNEDDTQVFEWFKTYVIGTKLDVGIEHHELTRQLIDPNLYWFSVPNIGPVLKGLSQGRKELLSFLNRRKYKEMMLAPLEKKRLRLSQLDMRFHLRDLIGSGHLKTIESPTGLIVRVSRD